jgi:hypothetical protein
MKRTFETMHDIQITEEGVTKRPEPFHAISISCPVIYFGSNNAFYILPICISELSLGFMFQLLAIYNEIMNMKNIGESVNSMWTYFQTNLDNSIKNNIPH